MATVADDSAIGRTDTKEGMLGAAELTEDSAWHALRNARAADRDLGVERVAIVIR